MGEVLSYISALWVIVKKSSPNGRQSADSRPKVGRLSADSRPTVGRQTADRFCLKYRLPVGRQSADSRPTVGNVSVTCR